MCSRVLVSRIKSFQKNQKQMKKLLRMAALSVVRGKTEMANYYHRKVEQGKNKMLVLNAILW